MSSHNANIWRTFYDVDLRSLTTQNLKTGGDGTKTIDGKTWTLTNSASATSVDLTNGTGLVIVCNTTNSGYSNATITLPKLSLPIQAGVYGSRDYSIQAHIIRIMARVLLTNADADFEGARLGIEDSTAPTNQNFSIYKGRDSGDKIVAVATVSGTSTNTYSNGGGFTNDVLGLCFEAPDLFEAWTGIYDTSADRLPYTFSFHRGSQRSDMATPLLRLPAQPRLFLGAQSGNTNGTITATFTHLRVDVASKSPPR